MKRFLKTFGILIGSLIGLLLIAIVVIPLVVDVDKYRPQITKAVNQRINGSLDLGKLSLDLWGKVQIGIAGLKIRDAQDRQVLWVDEAYFHLPFSSVLSGNPELELKLNQPRVNIIQQKDGKLNVATLIKEEKDAATSDESGGSSSSAPPATKDQNTLELPGIVARARLSLSLLNALIEYKDETSGKSYQLSDFNLRVRDLSLVKPVHVEAWTELKSTQQLGGTAKFQATLTPHIKDNSLDRIEGVFKLNLDDLVVTLPKVFEKKKGVLAQVDGRMWTSKNEAQIDRLEIKFLNAVTNLKGSIRSMQGQPEVDFVLSTNPIDLAAWPEVIPALRDLSLQGVAQLEGRAQGPASSLNYGGNLSVKDVILNSEYLKVQPKLDLQAKIATDRLESLSLLVQAGKESAQLNGKVVSFSEPRFDFKLSSQGLNLDQWLDQSKFDEAAPKSAGTGAAPAPNAQTGGSAGPAAADDYDLMLDSLRNSSMAQKTSGRLAVDLASIQAQGIAFKPLHANLVLKDLVVSLSSLNGRLWDGKINMKAESDLKPKTPRYQFSGAVENMEMRHAVASQMAILKNTVRGKTSLTFEGSGSSFNPDTAKKNLKLSGKWSAKDATFASIDVGRMASEALNRSIDKLAAKVPQLKGKQVKGLSNKESLYQSISTDISVADGKIQSPNFVAKAVPQKGIDLSGKTTIGMLDYSLDANWEVKDTYNMLKAKDLSVEHQGIQVQHILASGNEPVRFPVHVGCKIDQPCYSYTQVPEYLAKIALKNVGQAAEGKLKAEVKTKLEQELKKATQGISPELKDKAKSLREKLFKR